MNVTEAIKKRKSVRNYLDKPIENEKLMSVLEAGRLAPSACNRQEWRFVIVRDSGIRRKLVEAANNQSFVGEAPIVIVACAENYKYLMPCGQPSYSIDIALSLDHISLAAVELGLGSCWIGDFNEIKVKEILDIPDKIRVVALMPMGYPSDPSVVRKERLPLAGIIKYDKW